MVAKTAETLHGLGELARWSFGYGIVAAEPGSVGGRGVQLLKRLTVHEASPVLVPSNDQTRTLSMAGVNDDEAVAERIARDFEQQQQDELANQVARYIASIRS